MADIVESLLNGSVVIEELKVWLISDTVETSQEKADFIPYFINYLKENCAWLVCKENKCSESPSVKLKSGDNSCYDIKNAPASANRRVSNEFTEKNKRFEKHENQVAFVRSNRQVKIKEDNRVRLQSPRIEFYNDLPKKISSEKSFPKHQSFAKKSLNFNSVSDRKANVHSRNAPAFEENIRSFEAFPPLDPKSNNSKTRDPKKVPFRRRITPTPVQEISRGSSKFGVSMFATPPENVPNEVFKKTPFVENPTSDLQSEREMLKMQRSNFPQSAISNSFNDLKTENISPKKSATVHYITPDPVKVSHTKQLEAFSSIYDTLIANALVPNVTSELYFIFELLTSKALIKDKPTDKNNIFCSIHNCTFFGVTVLGKIQSFLNLLDKNTLSSLCEIPFLSEFSSQLVSFLQSSCKEKQELGTRSQSLNRVPFLLEEDSRENFIDSHSFTSFRKQRDLFYELLRDWQQQSLGNADKRFQENFSRKAKQLISFGPNAVNMYHLAKLFHNQMIASCLGLEVNEVYDELLSDIQRNFPGKFEKLHQRLMMPFCVGEPNPPPSFYGIQSFFSELVLAASSTVFNQQLQDIFVCKILEFNNADIFSDEELSLLGTVKEKYIFLLHTLRLLGKFHGFLYFLPYKVPEPLPPTIVNNQLNSRKHLTPPFDILKVLRDAVEKNRVILTVPWIVEYLSMIDPVAKNLPYIEETLRILVTIYRGNYVISPTSLNFWFLRVLIGWLFDVLNYPFKYKNLLQPVILEKNVKSDGLDFLAIIDKQLVHSCCPYLIEFKVLVHSFLSGIKNKREVRKITPLSTTTPRALSSLSERQTEIQIQLQENFFFLHSPSMKKTVEFVSERVASKIINQIRMEITEFKLYSIKYITDQETYNTLLSTKSTNGNKLQSFIDSCILELYEKSQSKIVDFINVKCHQDINHAMRCLSADDIKTPVLAMCCEICFRYAVDKITDWCDANLTLLDIQKDIKNKLNHLSKGEGDTVVEKDLSISSIIQTMRNLAVKVPSFSCDTKADHIKVLSQVIPLLEKEIGGATKKLIAFLTVDLYVSFIVYHPEDCDDEYERTFISVWSMCPKHYELETYFLGAQNIKYLLVGQNLELSCKKFTLMLLTLITINIFDSKKIKDYLMKLNSFQWKDSRSLKVLHLVNDALKDF